MKVEKFKEQFNSMEHLFRKKCSQYGTITDCRVFFYTDYFVLRAELAIPDDDIIVCSQEFDIDKKEITPLNFTFN